MNWHFKKEHRWMDNKHIKRCAILTNMRCKLNPKWDIVSQSLCNWQQTQGLFTYHSRGAKIATETPGLGQGKGFISGDVSQEMRVSPQFSLLKDVRQVFLKFGRNMAACRGRGACDLAGWHLPTSLHLALWGCLQAGGWPDKGIRRWTSLVVCLHDEWWILVSGSWGVGVWEASVSWYSLDISFPVINFKNPWWATTLVWAQCEAAWAWPICNFCSVVKFRESKVEETDICIWV